MKKKCFICEEVKSEKDFTKDKKSKYGMGSYCRTCNNKKRTAHRNTERGFLLQKYNTLSHREFTNKRWGRKSKCHFTWDEFLIAWEKHKSIYGMKSAWGPGPNQLEQHLPVTTITPGTKRAKDKKTPRIMSNLSADRLDNNRDYTIQNLIFMRNEENARKKDTSYEDCKIQIKLYEERFKNEIEKKGINIGGLNGILKLT